jgi:hypothetical protein
VKYGSATIVDQPRSLELLEPGAAAAAIYDQPIALRLLYQDPASGEEHYLVRYPAGVRGRHHRHTAAHTIAIVEGGSMPMARLARTISGARSAGVDGAFVRGRALQGAKRLTLSLPKRPDPHPAFAPTRMACRCSQQSTDRCHPSAAAA